MTAQEMFEELGFKYKSYRSDFAYENDMDNKRRFIYFNLSTYMYCTNVYHVEIKFQKAINQQLKELGWLDE